MSTDILFQSLCRTLAHSLWQGLVLALLAGMVVLFTRQASAALRYNLLALLILLFIGGVALTLYIQLQIQPAAIGQSPVPGPAGTFFSPVLVTYTSDAGLQQQRQSVSQAMLGQVAGFLDRNALSIVGLWFLFFVFKCWQLFSGLRHIRRLRSHRVQPVSGHWNDRLEALKAALGITVPVRVLESALVKTPSVLGFFRPLILLPAGLLVHMSPAEAEAMLLHELAHIRRKDYLVNLVQGLGETVLFFNPGFMWVSALLRTERENCCDDMAVAVTRSKTALVRALVASRQYGLDHHRLALGFGHNKTPLLNRAKRLLLNSNHSLSTTEKTFLSVGLALGLCMVFAFSGSRPANAQKAPLPQPAVNADSLERVLRKTVLEKQLAAAEKAVATHEHFMKTVTGSKRDEMERQHAELEMQRADIEMALADMAMQEADREMQLAMKEMALAEIEMKKAEEEAQKSEALFQELIDDLRKTMGTGITSFGLTRQKLVVNGKEQPAALHRPMADKYLKDVVDITYHYDLKTGHVYAPAELAGYEPDRAGRERQKAEQERLRLERERMAADSARQRARSYREAVQQNTGDDLVTALAKDLRERLGEITSFELGPQALLVNGRQQTAELHQLLKQKYLGKNMTVKYSLENGSKTTTIQLHH